MKTILVTGSNGQLGSEFRKLSDSTDCNFIFTDVDVLDITDMSSIEKFVANKHVDAIINCAAYTQVDKAEDDAELADKINHLAVENLAKICKDKQLTLIHISTDYVFDGCQNIPYIEKVQTTPLGIYGATKLAGEKAVIASGCNYLIIRTSWLYSSFGNNFVKTMRRLTAERDSLNVVFDQVGTPTYAADLASAILEIISNDKWQGNNGIYHFSNEGVCSWFDFAVEIAKISGNRCNIKPCHSDEFPSKVKRPNYSVLDKTKFKTAFGVDIPYWKDSLEKCIGILDSES